MKKIFFLFAAVLFALGLAEAGYRIYYTMSKPLYRPSSIDGLGWEFSPRATNATPGKKPGATAYLINDHGFRDRTSGSWMPWQPGELKTVIVGDSVTAGPGVSYDQTYSAQLETLLQQDGAAARVINGGVDATNTRQQFAWLKNKALPLQPDLVLLGYFMNDVEARSFEKFPTPARFLLRHFHLGVFLSQRIVQSIRNHREGGRYQGDFKSGEEKSSVCGGYVRDTLLAYQTKQWTDTAVWIRRIQDLCSSRGIRFGVVLFPFEDQIRGVCPLDAQKEISLFLQEHQIPFLDLAEGMSLSVGQPLYLPGDPAHLNEAGHRAAALLIKEWLAAQGILQLKSMQ